MNIIEGKRSVGEEEFVREWPHKSERSSKIRNAENSRVNCRRHLSQRYSGAKCRSIGLQVGYAGKLAVEART